MRFTNPNELSICFIENGGLGDCLLCFPLIEAIQKNSPCKIKIDFYARQGALFSHLSFLEGAFTSPRDFGELTPKYDAIFAQKRYSDLFAGDEQKVKRMYPQLMEFIAAGRRLKKMFHNYRSINEYCVQKGYSRINQSDLFDIWHINKNWRYPVQSEESSVLKKFGLFKKTYITLNRSTDSLYNTKHPKLWALNRYNELIKLLKAEFNDIVLVQLGVSEQFGIMDGIDLNLLGKINFDECAILLKNALLHIDGEGGLVHLNHFVGGRSCVLFGPTDPKVFGWPENINIRSTTCPKSCDWLKPNWTEACIKTGRSPAPCMEAISANYVFEKIKEQIKPVK